MPLSEPTAKWRLFSHIELQKTIRKLILYMRMKLTPFFIFFLFGHFVTGVRLLVIIILSVVVNSAAAASEMHIHGTRSPLTAQSKMIIPCYIREKCIFLFTSLRSSSCLDSLKYTETAFFFCCTLLADGLNYFRQPCVFDCHSQCHCRWCRQMDRTIESNNCMCWKWFDGWLRT